MSMTKDEIREREEKRNLLRVGIAFSFHGVERRPDVVELQDRLVRSVNEFKPHFRPPLRQGQ